ncbi:MAG TPA: carbohydrate kinase family protein, partial [Candidatus Parcubacteria bacterium]|nr:carbohydrate kinase family protein [Candidatus Parcubacteria bacterium]
KIDVKNVRINSGGGGTNTAASFVNQGFRAAYCGAVGNDIAGKEIVEELKRLGVKTDFVVFKKEKKTDHSIILSGGEKKDRVILVYQGASKLLCDKDIPWKKIKACLSPGGWFYLAPLSGKIAKLTEKIINFAHKNGVRVALNPGNSQISLSIKKISPILKKADVLFLNQEEASLLTKINFQEEEKILKKLSELSKGILVITKGAEGVVVLDKNNLYRAGVQKIKVADSTGAGDSFAAGFISGLIKENDIVYAIQLGTANSASCLKMVGAQNGLLKKEEKFAKIKVEKKALTDF